MPERTSAILASCSATYSRPSVIFLHIRVQLMLPRIKKIKTSLGRRIDPHRNIFLWARHLPGRPARRRLTTSEALTSRQFILVSQLSLWDQRDLFSPTMPRPQRQKIIWLTSVPRPLTRAQKTFLEQFLDEFKVADHHREHGERLAGFAVLTEKTHLFLEEFGWGKALGGRQREIFFGCARGEYAPTCCLPPTVFASTDSRAAHQGLVLHLGAISGRCIGGFMSRSHRWN
ncbi:hypothetical protein K438DRAFT_729063 [Mycena galopus ATCC 62051]|nr:hypothetical protein K438DRAFT_729063 [Mycena galopus ATCC 62051]